jgi:protein phosphatase
MNEQPPASIETVPEPTQPDARPAAPESTPAPPVPSMTDEPALGESDAPSSVEAEGYTAVLDPDGAPPDAVDDGFLDDLVLPALVNAPEPLMPETEIGPDARLRIVEHLGTRGLVNMYAAVWRQDDGTDVEVELREGPADHVGLRRETDVLTGIQFAMLPRCYAAWEAADRRYLAVESFAGRTLADGLAQRPPVEQTLSILLQLVQVVRRLHRAGWALLGLTPADVSVGRPIQLRHLGQAGRLGEPAPHALQVAGYSAPELAYQEPVTGKEDVYSLGAILHAALVGRPPADGAIDVADLPEHVRLPGGPQVLADALAPADERLDIEALYHRLLALKSRHAEMSLSLEVASATTLGLNPTRLVNEDSCCHAVWARTGADGTKETALLCVADGMGGMEAGEVASQTAVAVLMRGAVTVLWPSPSDSAAPVPECPERAESPPRPAPVGPASETNPSAIGPRLDPIALVRQAATAVHAAAQGREMGTTITCVAVHDGELTLAHVGDTRAYLLREGDLIRLTTDHSLVAAMVASGVISAEEAQGHPDSNKVLRSLGSQRELPDRYVDSLDAAYGQTSLPLHPEDRLVLCSDGVWGTVEDREIQAILTEALSCQNAASALIARALRAGAPDNATAIVARCLQRPVL